MRDLKQIVDKLEELTRKGQLLLQVPAALEGMRELGILRPSDQRKLLEEAREVELVLHAELRDLRQDADLKVIRGRKES